MSLTLEAFGEALRLRHVMDERLTKLIGFSPATGNHYGIIQLYNHHINEATTDEEILKIRAAYLEWRNGIKAILVEMGLELDEEQFCKLFSVSTMYGTLSFLDIPVDVRRSMAAWRKDIEAVLADPQKFRLWMYRAHAKD